MDNVTRLLMQSSGGKKDSTYVDDRGYFNIQLPRNNYYRLSFYPPDDADDIGNHNQLELDRYGITNINDAIASFNFQSNKFYF